MGIGREVSVVYDGVCVYSLRRYVLMANEGFIAEYYLPNDGVRLALRSRSFV